VKSRAFVRSEVGVAMTILLERQHLLRRTALAVIALAGLTMAPARAKAAGRIALFHLDTTGLHAASEADRRALEDVISAAAGDAGRPLGYSVVTDAAAMVDAAYLCDAACLGKRALALGAKYFIAGTFTSAGDTSAATLKLFASSDGDQLGYMHIEGAQLQALTDRFNARAKGFFEPMVTQERTGPRFALSLAGVGLGVATVLVGAVLGAQGRSVVANSGGLGGQPASEAIAQKANKYFLAADILLGAGAAIAVAGGVGVVLTWPRRTSSNSGSGGELLIGVTGISGRF
jgi:hypothetical protein